MLQRPRKRHQPTVSPQFETISNDDPRYPARLLQLPGSAMPANLTALGSLAPLHCSKTALFCSSRCPGEAILRGYDQAARWRDAGRCIISGFHSPVERECLRILLRGSQPVILCPARSLERIRVPAEWQIALADGRLLMLSGFS